MLFLKHIEFAPDRSVLIYTNCQAFPGEGRRLNCISVAPSGLVTVFQSEETGFTVWHALSRSVQDQVRGWAKYFTEKFGQSEARPVRVALR